MRRTAFLLACIAVGACVRAAMPAAYGAELQACTSSAATLAESQRCENEVRSRYGRPLLDGGPDGGGQADH